VNQLLPNVSLARTLGLERVSMSRDRRVRIGLAALIVLCVMLGLHAHPMFHLVAVLAAAALIFAVIVKGRRSS
jgi:hypothetical protein